MTVKLWHVFVVAGILIVAGFVCYFEGRQSQINKNAAVVTELNAQHEADLLIIGDYFVKLQNNYTDLMGAKNVIDHSFQRIKDSIFWQGMPQGQRATFTLQLQTIDGQFAALIKAAKQNSIADKRKGDQGKAPK